VEQTLSGGYLKALSRLQLSAYLMF
jgi:hypothetical protein